MMSLTAPSARVARAAAPASARALASRRAVVASRVVAAPPARRASASSRARLAARPRAMADESEEDFEARLSVLRGTRSKKAVKTAEVVDDDEPASKAKAPPRGQRRKGVKDFTTVGSIEEPAGADWGPETVKYEGPPARGEVVANLAMSWTIVWIPLTIAAVGRAVWSSYKITDKRVSVLSTSPLRTERIDVPLGEIVDVVAIGRGVGLWGDMVVTLKNQEKVELRSVPEFKDIEQHIRERMGEADPEYAKI